MRSISRVLSYTIVTAVLAAFPLTPVRAGDHHRGPTLNCSDCHISHASLTHGQTGKAANWSQTPSAHLTKGATVTAMCLQCHNNQPGIPDIVGLDVNNPSELYDGTERAAGQFADGSADNWKGHNLVGQGNSGPGDCTACHDPHGNANYRNLRALDGSADGPLAYVNPLAIGLERYRRSNIGYAKNIGDKLCMRCHDFGVSGAHRHPSSTRTAIVTIASSGGHTDSPHWTTGTGSGFEEGGQSVPRVPFAVSTATSYEAAAAVTADDEVFCLSCHKAHGSVHSFGMLWPYGSSDGLVGSSGCNQCHNISGG